MRYALRFGFWKTLLAVLGLGPRRSSAVIDPEVVHVRMGWAFRAHIDRPSIVRVAAASDKWAGIGVHGWRGRWLVNGAVSGIVTIEIDPPGKARVMGVPIRLHTLHVSLDDPDAFLDALAR
jgi:hypothetical protein